MKENNEMSYELVNGEEMHQLHPDTFDIPSAQEKADITKGTQVKLVFDIDDGNHGLAERMWVITKEKLDEHYVGILNNNPISTDKLRAGDEVIFGAEHVIDILHDKSKASETKSQLESFLAIGICIDHRDYWDQLEISVYIWGQVNLFATNDCGGYIGSFDLVGGFLQIAVYCEDPDKSLSEFLSKLSSGKIDIPEDNGDVPVFQYALIGEGDPVDFMFDVMHEDECEDCICDECRLAMNQQSALHAVTKSNIAGGKTL